jgi:hypothetical protein
MTGDRSKTSPVDRRVDAEEFPFFVGYPRSGTTLFRAIFDSHPRMAIPGESHFIVPMAGRRTRYETDTGFRVDRFVEDLLAEPRFRLWELRDEEVRALFGVRPPASLPAGILLAFEAYASHHGKPRAADKTPAYVWHLPVLDELFPRARFVHILRDGRDVALSHVNVEFLQKRLEEAAVYWRDAVLGARRFGRTLGRDRYREVRYEDLLDDPEGTVRSLCEFVNLDFDASMLRYFERAEDLARPAHHPEAHRGLALPPTKGLRDWRTQMSPRDLAVFEVLAGDALSRFGYERAVPRPKLAVRLAAEGHRAQITVHRFTHAVNKRVRGSARRADTTGVSSRVRGGGVA